MVGGRTISEGVVEADQVEGVVEVDQAERVSPDSSLQWRSLGRRMNQDLMTTGGHGANRGWLHRVTKEEKGCE